MGDKSVEHCVEAITRHSVATLIKFATPPPSLHTKLLKVSGSGPVDRPPLAIHHNAMKLVVGPARVGMPAQSGGTGALTIAPPS